MPPPPPSPDPRWTRSGRPLRDWLLDLVSLHTPTRRLAEDTVYQSYLGLDPSQPTTIPPRHQDIEQHRRDWGNAVAATFASPDFPAHNFLPALLARIKIRHQRNIGLARLGSNLSRKDDDSQIDEQIKRHLLQQIKAIRDQVPSPYPRTSPASFAPSIVLEHLGTTLLRFSHLLRSALKDPGLDQHIANALQNIGPPAADFLPDLLTPKTHTGLQSETFTTTINFPQAIAAIGPRDLPTLLHLRQTLLSGHPQDQRSASDALRRLGSAATALLPTLVDDLLLASANPTRSDLLHTAAALAPARRNIFDRILAIAANTTPDLHPIQTTRNGSMYIEDFNHWRRGPALSSLALFPSFAAEAISTLIGALDNFIEYDPDLTYSYGQHTRILRSLRQLLGFDFDTYTPTSIPPELLQALLNHLPTFLPHFRDADNNVDWNTIRLLGQLGPPARPLLPHLLALQSETEPPDPTSPPTSTPNIDFDTLTYAIHRISRT